MSGFYHFLEIVGAAVGAIIVAFAGVLMRYFHIQQRGEKVEWSRIWVEGPTVLVMGLAGFAVHEYFGIPEVVGYIAAAFLGYLGPSAVNLIVDVLKKRAEK